MGEPDIFDVSAAGLRADGGDLRISLEALASKLEAALPGRTRVQRRGGLLGRGRRSVRSLEVRLGDCRYELAVDDGSLAANRQREVAGVTIKRERMDTGAWVAALTEELRAQASESEQARTALEDLLG